MARHDMEPEATSVATVSESSHDSVAARGSRLDRAWGIFFPVGVQMMRWPDDREIPVGGEPYVVIADKLEGIPASLVAQAQGLIVVSRAPLNTGDLRRLGFDHVRRWAVLPSLDDVRWLMPVDGVGAALGALDLYTPYRRRARLARSVARGAVRVGALTRMSASLWVARRDEPAIVRRLADATGLADLRLALQLGRRGRIPKLTSGVMDPSGGLQAIARIAPRGSPATILMQRESDMLSALRDRFAEASPGPYVHASGTADGFDLTVQTIIPGRPVGTPLDGAGERFLERLGGGVEGPMAATEQVRSLIARASNAAELPMAASAMAAIAGRLESAQTPKTIVHGDFAPWNLRLRDGVVRAFDWEFGWLDGLPLLDELHHRLQVRHLHGDGPDRLAAVLRATVAERLSSRDPAGPAIGVVYVVDQLLRAFEETGDAHSGLVARYLAMLGRLRG